MRLGLHIRERRRAAGMSAAQLAELFGVKQSAVSKWENGITDPGDDKLDAIAGFLGVPRSEVVLMRDGSADDDRTTELENRLDRVEQRLEEVVRLLGDLDRRIRGTSQGGDEEA